MLILGQGCLCLSTLSRTSTNDREIHVSRGLLGAQRDSLFNRGKQHYRIRWDENGAMLNLIEPMRDRRIRECRWQKFATNRRLYQYLTMQSYESYCSGEGGNLVQSVPELGLPAMPPFSAGGPLFFVNWVIGARAYLSCAARSTTSILAFWHALPLAYLAFDSAKPEDSNGRNSESAQSLIVVLTSVRFVTVAFFQC